MLLKERDFNHDKDEFHEAMNIPGYIRTKCRERIFFAAFSNALQRAELFEDEVLNFRIDSHVDEAGFHTYKSAIEDWIFDSSVRGE